ncbi:MAG: hypothetical protein DMG05_25660, partial [Acidobacteria bacterium]
MSPDITLEPGQWQQLNSVLSQAGFSNGYALIERISGSDPYLAYAVINDNVTNDGSFVPAIPVFRPTSNDNFEYLPTVTPVVLETALFESELILANPNLQPMGATLQYAESLASPRGTKGFVTETLEPGEQKIIPGAIQYLRNKGAEIGPSGGRYAGAVFVDFFANEPFIEGFVGARTAAAGQTGGQYGLFTPGALPSEAAGNEGWVFALKQDDTTRSNLALINVMPGGFITVQYEVFDGTTGIKAATSNPISIPPDGWIQINNVLKTAGVSNGYIRVVKIADDPYYVKGQRFLAYGVINDGAESSSGTNDGSFVP